MIYTSVLKGQDSEDEPIAPKARKRKRIPQNDPVKIDSNHSQLMSK